MNKNYKRIKRFQNKIKITDFTNFIKVFIVAIFVCTGWTVPAQMTYNVELWLKADQIQGGGILPNNVSVAQWDDKSAAANNFVQYGTSAIPVYRQNGMNFHPSVHFEAPAKKLVSQDVFPIDAGKIYRSFYVLAASNMTGTNYGSIFAYRDNQREGWRGLTSADYLYYYGGSPAGYSAFNPAAGKRYGIISIDRSGSVWHNAKPATGGAARAFTGAANTRATVGTATSTGTGSPFYGDIQEIIIISKPSGSPFTVMDHQIVTSYLAIKYGQSLDTVNQPNLYNSAGAPVWTFSNNIGYNKNIFGVGRDEATGLYQRQSVNYEDNTLTAFTGTYIAGLNVNNNGVWENMVYLIFGSNGLSGTTAYAQPYGEVFANKTLTNEFFSMRQSRLYKAQVTGAAPAVINLQVQKFKAKYIMVSGTDGFVPANTRLYPINEYGIANNVEIYDGDHIGFVLSEKTPGGVTAYNVELWLKADEAQGSAVLPNNMNVTRWENQSGTMLNFVQNGNDAVPVFKHEGMNFNPSVDFPAARRLVSEGVFPTDNGTLYRSFYVSTSRLAANNAWGAMFAYRNNNDEGWRGGNTATYLYLSNGTGTAAGNNTSLNVGLPKRYGIVSMDREGRIWHNAKPGNGLPRLFTGAAGSAVIGGKVATGTITNPFIGDIQEIIIISTASGTFNDLDVKKITSYLAIKYGQTLESDQPDLYSSAGDTVWTASKHAGYTSNVFGIGRDDATGLYQKQSANYENNILTAFLSSLQTLNANNTGTLDNMTYLILGSNGLGGLSSYIQPEGSEFLNLTLTDEYLNVRLSCVYNAQVTGADSVSTNLQLKNFIARYVMVSDSDDFIPENTKLYPFDAEGIAKNVVISDGDYIGFTFLEKTPGGVTNGDFVAWLTSDNYGDGMWVNLMQDGIGNFTGATTPPHKLNAGGYNYHPIVLFEKPGSSSSAPNQLYSQRSMNMATSESVTSIFVFRRQGLGYYDFLIGTSNANNYNALSWRSGTTHDLTSNWGGTGRNLGATDKGILAIGNANTSLTAVQEGIKVFKDGLKTTFASNAWNSTTNLGNGRVALGGGRNNQAWYGYRGNLQEVILVKKGSNQHIDDIDMQKIHSYLAIKYGIMLNNNDNYLNTDGNVVWNRALNTGYNNHVFGIARDDATNLYQRQSVNSEDATLTAFLGNRLYDLNSRNTNTLVNMTYLLLGSNGENGTVDYVHPEGAQFANRTLDGERFFKRQQRLYKAQLSGTDSITVSFQIQKFKAKYVIVSDATDFISLNTRVYDITEGIALNVQLHNGDYIGFVMDETMPGGVSNYNLVLWLKADNIQERYQPNDGAAITRWENYSGLMFDFVQYATAAVPVYKNNGMNYQPSLRFATSAKKLVSEVNFQTYANTNRIYRSFYVTKSNMPATNNTYGSVFSYRDTYDEGWCYHNAPNTGNYLYYNDNATTTIATYSIFGPDWNYRYGITSMDRSGTVWHNARSATGAAARPIIDGVGIAAIGTRGAANVNNPFYGDVQEVIILSSPYDTPFDPTDVAKINTYLAVKYGQMLDTIAQPQWLRSDDSIIWNTATNTGYNNNIFGIGRDDAAGLYQKQSFSVGSSEKITAFVGDHAAPAQLNMQNTGELDNGFFLMFGSNGIKSTNANRLDYAYPTGEEFMNDTIVLDLHYRHPTVLLARITDTTKFTVNMYMGGLKVDYLLVSDDPDFPPALTRIYYIDGNFTAADVIINDGDYIGFSYQRKSPGGIFSNLRMWLKADEVSTVDLIDGNVQEWRDFSDNTDNVYYYYSRVATPSGNALPPGFRTFDPDMNFHPSVDFRRQAGTTGGNRELLITDQAPFSVAAPYQYSLICVVRLREFYHQDRSYFITFGAHTLDANTRRPAFGFQTRRIGGLNVNVGRSYQIGTEINGAKELYRTNATTACMFITDVNTPTATGAYLKFEADGEIDSIRSAGTGSFPAIYNNRNSMIMNARGVMGAGSLSQRSMIGTMSEVIAYEKVLDGTERDKIYSYLGLKYGITLSKDKSRNDVNFDYFLSDGSIVWAGASDSRHSKYHNNVAAIVRDDAANLNNQQSHSTNEGSSILMGIGSRLGASPSLTGLNTDKETIIWGNNAGDFSIKTYAPPEDEECGQMTSIMSNRIWMVDVLTQEDYAVLIGAGDQGFSSAGFAFPFGENWDVWMLIADSEEKIEQGEWDHVIPGVWVDNLHQFNIIFEKGKTYYFTFGGTMRPGSCEACDVNNRLSSIVFNTQTWRNRWTSANFMLSNRGLSAAISTGFEGTGNARFSGSTPRAVGGVLRFTRSGNMQQKLTTTIEIDSAAMATFDLRKIDFYSKAYTDVSVYGLCGGGKIIPYLGFMSPERNVGFTIDQAAGKASAFRNRHLSYANRNGWMYVEFEDAVEKIVIEHTMRGTAGVKYFGIGGPIHFACPAPPPPINEDGLSFTQQAMPQETLLCEQVSYTFRIQNTNCDNKQVELHISLPEGMKWLNNSLVIDSINAADAVINDYEGTPNIDIQNLTVMGVATTVIRARAYFDMSATDKAYSSTAYIKYDRIVNDFPMPILLYSCDRMSAGCMPTTVIGLPTENRMYPLEITEFELDKKCFTPGEILTATIKVNNPNPQPIPQSVLDVAYNDDFVLQNHNVSCPTISASALGAPELYEEGGGGFILAGAAGNGFSIPAGAHTFTFRLIAPDVLQPYYDYNDVMVVDESGFPMHTPFDITFDFYTYSEADCSASVFYEAYGDAIAEPIPYVCITGPTVICMGDSSQLSRWTGGSWSSSDEAVATVDSISGKIMPVSGGKVAFSFLMKDAECVAISDTLTVKEVRIFATNDGYLCGATGVTLSVPNAAGFSGNETYAWYEISDPDTILSTNDSLQVSIVGNYNVIVTDEGCSCAASNDVEVQEGVTPDEPEITVTNNGYLCGNDSEVTLSISNTADYSGDETYAWYEISEPETILGTDSILTVSAAGDYNVIVTDNGCSATATNDVEILNGAVPDKPIITATNNGFLCTGGEVVMRIFNTTAYSTEIFAWHENSQPAIILSADDSLTVSDMGVYTFTVSNANCQNHTTMNVGALTIMPPSAATPQIFCSGATIANLQADGTGIKWYNSSGVLMQDTDLIFDKNIYHAVQTTVEGCEGKDSTAVTVIIDDDFIIAPPNLPGLFELCAPATVADIPTYGNTNLLWYDAAVGGSVVPPNTPLLNDTTTLYATLSGGGTCESIQRTEVNIIITDSIPKAPTMDSPQHFCDGVLVANLITPNNQIAWYLGTGVPLNPDDKLTTGTYYAAQKAGSCESEERTPVEVVIGKYPPPAVQDSQTTCNGKLMYVSDLIIIGAGIKWYDENYDEITDPTTEALIVGKTYYATQSSGDCESDSIAIVITDRCYDPYGTIFPFVHTGDSAYDAQFMTTAKLFVSPPATILDKMGYVRKQSPIQTVRVKFYDCATDTIVGAPLYPGIVGRTDNPGLLIRWHVIGVIPGTPNTNVTTLINPCLHPDTIIGKYTFENIAPGKYVLEITRQGFLARYGEITVTDDNYLRHREILGGDVNGDLMIDQKDLSAIRLKTGVYGSAPYNHIYDFNGDKTVNSSDVNVIRVNLNTYTTLYQETEDWINPRK